ncbi:MAG: hypothetical protein HOM58_21200 [Rhodospirillaceae bacterium]|jgi:hypothetical protein|nr:hypothetical protein [Rhodospirillaceae bacterium]
MCTSIVEIVAVEGAARNGDSWFNPTQAVVTYDHPHVALLADGVNIDFMRDGCAPSTRAAVELTLESAKALHAALARTIEAAEIQEAEAHRPTRMVKAA